MKALTGFQIEKNVFPGGLPFTKTGIKLKHYIMKKLAILMIVSSFAACGSGTSTTTTDSTSVVKKDTMTMSGTDTTHTMTVDSTKKTTDSTEKITNLLFCLCKLRKRGFFYFTAAFSGIYKTNFIFSAKRLAGGFLHFGRGDFIQPVSIVQPLIGDPRCSRIESRDNPARSRSAGTGFRLPACIRP